MKPYLQQLKGFFDSLIKLRPDFNKVSTSNYCISIVLKYNCDLKILFLGIV